MQYYLYILEVFSYIHYLPFFFFFILGQIAANEALKKDLEGVISGLQEYLETIKGQATQAQNECRKLQEEKETLLQKLTEVEQERDQLEIVAIDAENMRKV